MSDSCDTMDCQAPLSMGFPKQDYWSGFSFSSPWNLPEPDMKPTSPALQVDSLPLINWVSLTIQHNMCLKRFRGIPMFSMTACSNQYFILLTFICLPAFSNFYNSIYLLLVHQLYFKKILVVALQFTIHIFN